MLYEPEGQIGKLWQTMTLNPAFQGVVNVRTTW